MGAYGADSGSCGLPAVSLLVPAVFNGYGKYDVRLYVEAYDLSNVLVVGGAPQNVDLIGLVNVRTTEVGKAHRLTISFATLNAVDGAAPPAAGYYFKVTATNLQDRISRKHSKYSFNTINVANADPDGVGNDYRYYVYPTPTTQPIQHIQNNY